MKPKDTLRLLAGLSFLIFFCPFFKTCSFDSARVLSAISGKPYKEKTQREKIAEEKENTYSGYRLIGEPFWSPQVNYGNGEGPNPSAYFLIVFMLSCAVLYFALRQNYDNVFWFSAISLGLLIPVMLILLPVYPILRAQYGLYLLMANNIILMIFSRKAHNRFEIESYSINKTPVT